MVKSLLLVAISMPYRHFDIRYIILFKCLFISGLQKHLLWLYTIFCSFSNMKLTIYLTNVLLWSLPLPFTENICHAKYGRRVVTHHALSHGHTVQCELSYCDNRCLERCGSLGPWTNWGWLLKADKNVVRDFGESTEGNCYIMFLDEG